MTTCFDRTLYSTGESHIDSTVIEIEIPQRKNNLIDELCYKFNQTIIEDEYNIESICSNHHD